MITTKAGILTSRVRTAPPSGQDRTGASEQRTKLGALSLRESEAAPPPPQLAAMRRGVLSRKATKICN